MGESKTVKFQTDQLTQSGHNLLQFAQQNPVLFGLSSVAIAAGIAIIVVPVAAGFGPAGPTSGSLAAVWMSEIGNIPAGSFFAMLQSLTMTGTLHAIGGGLIAAGALGFVGGECMRRLQEVAEGVDWACANVMALDWLKGEEWAKAAGEMGNACQGFGEQVAQGCEGAARTVVEGSGYAAAEVAQGCEVAARTVVEGCGYAAAEVAKGWDGFAAGVQSTFGRWW